MHRNDPRAGEYAEGDRAVAAKAAGPRWLKDTAGKLCGAEFPHYQGGQRPDGEWSSCINLKEAFPTYRIGYEDPEVQVEDPWHFVLICRHGHIAPWGGQYLHACTDRPRSQRLPARPKKAPDKLFALTLDPNNTFRVTHDGDDGINVVFHISEFEFVKPIMKPRRV